MYAGLALVGFLLFFHGDQGTDLYAQRRTQTLIVVKCAGGLRMNNISIYLPWHAILCAIMVCAIDCAPQFSMFWPGLFKPALLPLLQIQRVTSSSDTQVVDHTWLILKGRKSMYVHVTSEKLLHLWKLLQHG